ncbi:unnamed protein product [Adineta ricciae]|uniref:Uncharacterized protein n=1 Tax=Adineta ricciae TaxID=249248 RepID=A0A815TRN2_ADIRI|nr:unnamed protein product [Adineta ricciae]
MDTPANENEKIWMKVKSSSGIEELVPRLVDVQSAKNSKNRLKYRCCLLFLLLLLIGLILLAILLPIYLLKHKTSITINNSTTSSSSITTATPQITCIYPNVYNNLTKTCVNILIDSNNCGQINNKCSLNMSCSAGICVDVPGILLNNSKTIFSSSVNGSADDQMFNVTLPWPITIYNRTTNIVIVTTDGVLCLDACSTIYTETNLPSNVFPGVTIFPYWDDLYIYSNTSQGIYYQSDGNNPNRLLTFEFYMSHYQLPREYYHFQVLFFENSSNIVQVKYFQVSDRGSTCTIGVQASSTGPFISYSYDQENSIDPNTSIIFNTNLGTFNKTSFES